ncbi:hypothetical protein ADUPG1_005768, partial [Aduncisulcus paluster]
MRRLREDARQEGRRKQSGTVILPRRLKMTDRRIPEKKGQVL